MATDKAVEAQRRKEAQELLERLAAVEQALKAVTKAVNQLVEGQTNAKSKK